MKSADEWVGEFIKIFADIPIPQLTDKKRTFTYRAIGDTLRQLLPLIQQETRQHVTYKAMCSFIDENPEFECFRPKEP